jgi:hypothetical protein
MELKPDEIMKKLVSNPNFLNYPNGQTTHCQLPIAYCQIPFLNVNYSALKSASITSSSFLESDAVSVEPSAVAELAS